MYTNSYDNFYCFVLRIEPLKNCNFQKSKLKCIANNFVTYFNKNPSNRVNVCILYTIIYYVILTSSWNHIFNLYPVRKTEIKIYADADSMHNVNSVLFLFCF